MSAPHAFDEGYIACAVGRADAANPYLFGADEYLYWLAGYEAAAEQEATFQRDFSTVNGKSRPIAAADDALTLKESHEQQPIHPAG